MTAIAAAEAFASAAEIGMWFVGAWIFVEVLRLVFSGFGVGENRGSMNPLRWLHDAFQHVPGGGGHGGGGGGGGGGHGGVDLTPILQSIQQLRTDTENRFTNLDQNVSRVQQITTDTHNLSNLIYQNTQQLITYFTRWQAVFDEIRNRVNDILQEVQAHGRILANHTRVLTDIQTRVTQFERDLIAVKDQILAKIRELDTKLDAVTQSITQILMAITGIGTDVRAVNQKLDAVRGAMLQLPEQVRVKLVPELEVILDAIGKIPSGDIAATRVLIEESEGKIKRAITKAKNEIIDDAEIKIYGNVDSSMFTQLMRILEKMKKDIGDAVSEKADKETLEQVSKDVDAVNKEISPLIDELRKLLQKDIPEFLESAKLIDRLLQSANVVRSAEASIEHATKGAVNLTEKVEEEISRRQGVLRKVMEAKDELKLSREFNMAEAKKLSELSGLVNAGKVMKGKKRKKVRGKMKGLIRSLNRLEYRENYRANINKLINALKDLGDLIDQDFLKREEEKWRSYENDQTRGFPLIKKYLIQAGEESQLADLSWEKLPEEAEHLITGMRGLIVIENNLLEMVEHAEKGIEGKK